MKIIKPYAKIVGPCGTEPPEWFGLEALQHVEWAARVSHRSEEAQTDESWRKFLEAVVLKHGDWSVTEHVLVTVEAVVDRGITHEWVRHRIGGYTQESTRFVNYQKKILPAFVYPRVDAETCEYCTAGLEVKLTNDLRDLSKDERSYENPWVHDTTPHCETGGTLVICGLDPLWLDTIYRTEEGYKGLLNKGWRPQEARSVFPNALAAKLIVTYNLRMWRHFLIMRTSAEAHPQMRQVTVPLLQDFQERFPVLYDDIVPNEKQSLAMMKAR